MNKMLMIGLSILLFTVSCKKDDDNKLINLSGVYIETSPIIGRSQIIFTSSDDVTIKEAGSEDKFKYEIVGNAIKLTPQGDKSTICTLYFECINSSKFKIENLYPKIPENPTSYMIFEKK
jgi:hypothetical protein